MNEVTIYVSKDNQTQVEVKFEDDTVWLSQKQMAQLFDKNIMTINEHLKNELSTTKKSLIVRKERKREVKREIASYNLDAIMSVGYRVISKLVTQFRQWATQRLKDHLVKGCTINQEAEAIFNLIKYE